MSWILLSNDDGVDSPALIPFAAALERALDMPVRIAVPAEERSWSGKAVTRHGRVRAEWLTRGGRDVVAVHGTPADAVQLGMYGLFGQEFAAAPPRALITGINVGFNHGTAFLASSGTVWAAAEGAFAGLPAIAVSTGGGTDFGAWRAEAMSPVAAPVWSTLADVAADVVLDVSNTDVLSRCDLVSVNMPWTADLTTGRRVTRLAPIAYGPLFQPDGDGAWAFTDILTVHVPDHPPDGDVQAVGDGHVSITPVVLPGSSTVPEVTRTVLER